MRRLQNAFVLRLSISCVSLSGLNRQRRYTIPEGMSQLCWWHRMLEGTVVSPDVRPKLWRARRPEP